MSFIIVLHPRQRPGWADYYESKDDFIEAWINGEYDRQCFTNNNLSEADQEETFDNALFDVGHDLNGVTLLESRQEYEAYMKRGDQHNPAYDSVRRAAINLEWEVSR